MPPDFLANSFRTSQVADTTRKATMTSAPPVSPMTQNPQYSTTTTTRPFTGNSQILTFPRNSQIPTFPGNSQMPTFHMPNASVDPLPTHQRLMTQLGYVNPMITPNYQPSAGLTPMNANNGWIG